MAKLRFDEYGGQAAEHQKWLEWLMCRNPAGTGEASLAFLPDGSLVAMSLNAALPMTFKNERFDARMNVSALVKRDQRGGHLFIRQLKMVCEILGWQGSASHWIPERQRDAWHADRWSQGCWSCVFCESTFIPALLDQQWGSVAIAGASKWLDNLVSQVILKAARLPTIRDWSLWRMFGSSPTLIRVGSRFMPIPSG